MNSFGRFIALASFLLAGTGLLVGQEYAHSMEVTFKVDGEAAPFPCPGPNVRLWIGKKHLSPRRTPTGFVVPAIFQQLYASKRSRHQSNVKVVVSCGPYTWNISGLYPVWVLPGHWELGIATPAYWYDEYGSRPMVEPGTWVSYLEDECNGCDPGVIRSELHDKPLPGLAQRLQLEQATAKGEKARDIAFSLAVMKVNERQNVNYLLRLLQSCSATRGGDPRYECDGKLVYEVSTLYWRGHNDLLLPLFGTGDFLESDSYPFAGRDVSQFYGYLLYWRQDALLTALAGLPAQTQQAVCHRAIAALPNTLSPALDEVLGRLRAATGSPASVCWKEAVDARTVRDERLQQAKGLAKDPP